MSLLRHGRLHRATALRGANNRRNDGIVLILVLGTLGLAMVLLLGLFANADTEHKSAHAYSSVTRTGQLAEIANNLVISQIKRAAAHDLNSPSTWISQPGAARRYDADGNLIAGYKLYSDSLMTVRPADFGDDPAKAELDGIAADAPISKWSESPARYVDLNEPVIRDGASFFPIVDPRGFDQQGRDGSDDVEGFSYSALTIAGTGIGGVIVPGRSPPERLRLPMPVEWLYVLEDGTLGHLDEDHRFHGPAKPTSENPIVGRVAFWTDDECTKINLNTASEPTYWQPPHYYHFEDYRWAIYQPAHHEFQRYPGHPATTAISPVLFPNKTLSWPDKEKIYDLIPRIGSGGSKGGSQFYTGGFVYAVDLDQPRGERLFASLDEVALNESRKENDFGAAGNGPELVSGRHFFLTADSVAPETNQFGQPRISIWPVPQHSEGGTEKRTAFDQLLAFCSTVGAERNPFYFQRHDADSQSYDINLPRNRELLSYLTRLTSQNVPGFGEGTFAQKYGDDRMQILVETFDYIRSTNLFDDLLTDKEEAPDLTGGGASWEPRLYANRPTLFSTFTDPRFKTSYVDPDTGNQLNREYYGYPGHGQVTPSLLEQDGKSYRGFGRMHTLSEIAVHFVCCADAGEQGERTGGIRANGTDGSPTYFSNFPPHPTPNPEDNPGLDTASYPYDEIGGVQGNDPAHPGYNPENWNFTLDRNTPLENGNRRVQATVLLEWFCPSTGWTLIHPEFSVRVRGLSNLKLNGQTMFPEDQVSIKSFATVGRMWGCHQNGGKSAGFRSFIRDRRVAARGDMLRDWGYNHGTWGDIMNYDMVSDYIDVEGDKMAFTVTGPVTVEIYDDHTFDELIQTVDVRFPRATELPAPDLVTDSTPEFTYVNSEGATVRILECLAPRWWGLNFYGALARQYLDGTTWRWQSSPIRGRFYRLSSAPITGHADSGPTRWKPLQGSFIYGRDTRNFRNARDADVVQSMVVKHGDYRLVAGRRHVTQDTFVPHRFWGQKHLAHSLTHHSNSIDPGADNALDGTSHDLIESANYPWWRRPDIPHTEYAASLSTRYGDFDSSVGSEADGAFINKPDEGNTADLNTNVPYLYRSWLQEQGGATFFSPNRQLPSPGMFGSLPSGVRADDPWKTLLFRRQQNHPGGPAETGGIDPPDHLLLDLFWMPVVEPYALSEPFSTRGKVNLNYQIVPFTNIRRATALHAVMKDEKIAAVKPRETLDNKRTIGGKYWDQDRRDWHRPINIPATLKQLDARFESGGTFKSASEICNIYLVPERSGADGTTESMEAFWDEHAGTSDNMRERPYTNIYSRLTTRSNTFRVHLRCQTIKKARSTDPAVFDPDKDLVQSEYRGSTLISRFISPDDPDIPDYATNPAAESLESFHQFRILSQRRFAP